MEYRITNKRGTFLSAFHSNGGWKLGDVFPCSKYSWFTFKTKEEANNYILRIIKECKDQRKRWGDWTETAIKFAKSLKYQAYNS